jgi:hypothetical protein
MANRLLAVWRAMQPGSSDIGTDLLQLRQRRK